MATATPEPRYPLALTERQLRALTGYLDTVSTSEADPDAEVFALIDQVRQVRKLIATSAVAPMIQMMTTENTAAPSAAPTLTLNAEAIAALAHYWQALDACTAVDDETVGEAKKAALWTVSELAAMELGALIAALAPVHLYKNSAASHNEPT